MTTPPQRPGNPSRHPGFVFPSSSSSLSKRRRRSSCPPSTSLFKSQAGLVPSAPHRFTRLHSHSHRNRPDPAAALPSSRRPQQPVLLRRHPAEPDVKFVLVTGAPVRGAEQPQDTYGEVGNCGGSNHSIAIPLASLAAQNEDYGATPPAMRTPGSRATAAGLTVMLLSVSASMHLDGFPLLLCFVGVVVGASLVAAGVSMADGPAPNPVVPVVFGGARALAAFMRRNTAAVGLIMASCAVTMVSGEEDPVLCFVMFALLLLGLTFVNIGARGE